jgi:FkbM family methyltransferase
MVFDVNTKIFHLIDKLESGVALLQGKGWGSFTLHLEVKAAAKLLATFRTTPPRICVDVGGCEGRYTEALLSQFNNSRVIVFEPSGKNYQILKTKFDGDSRVEVENFALSNKTGVSKLYADQDGSGLASLTRRNLDHFGISFTFAEEVKSIKFEDYWVEKLNRAEVGLLKLDIEGHELAALGGLGSSLPHIELIQFEFGGCNIDSRTYFQDFWNFFKRNHFNIFRLGPLGLRKVEHYSERDEFFSTTNYFAKRLY